MIQRRQTLWLLLSAVCASLSYKFSFFAGTKLINTAQTPAQLDGNSTFSLLIITGVSVLLSLFLIFLYKDRKLQFKLCLAGTALSVILIILYFLEKRNFETGSLSLSSLFVFAIPVGYILAAMGIRKDEKLVKSIDRLR